MDYYNLGVWFTAGVCLSESVRRRGEIVAVIGNTVAELMLVSAGNILANTWADRILPSSTSYCSSNCLPAAILSVDSIPS